MKSKLSALNISIALVTIFVVGGFGLNHSVAARLNVADEPTASRILASDHLVKGRQATLPGVDYHGQSRLLLADADSGNQESDARERWKNLSPEQKQRYRQRLKQWQQMSPEQQDEIIDKYKRYKNLTPDQRRKIRQNWNRYQQLTPEQKQRLKQKHKRWQNLSPQEKQRVKKRMRRYRNMTPEQRRRVQEKRKKWQSLPPEKREQLREEYRKKNRQRQRNQNNQ